MVLLVSALALAFSTLVLGSSAAQAHPLSTTAVLLDVGPREVTGRVELPIDRLALAVQQPTLTTDVAEQPGKIEEFRLYVVEHLAAASASDHAAWQVAVSGGTVETIDGVDHLVYDIVLRPPGRVNDFTLRYDGIVHHLLSHRVFVSSRASGAHAYTVVGVIDWQTQTLAIPVVHTSPERGFLTAVHLGFRHIAEGADHLLFLIMLLLPAPLLVRLGRWVRTDNLRRSCWRVVHVVTAFAVGHSITLALGALGLVHLPTRVIESGIALSILVSGLHAVRPFVRGGEVWIAAGFGLLHGLAFAALLGQLDLSRQSLLTELLGFNIGIELTQLMVVALVMPSLMVLSRTLIYPTVRIGLACLGVLLAAAWLAERTTLISTNPLEPLPQALVAHPFLVAITLALAAAAASLVPRWRAPSTGPSTTDARPRAELVDAS